MIVGIPTRPLGATLGDNLTKAHDKGGFDLSHIASSLVLAAVMTIGIVWMSRAKTPRSAV